MIDIANREMVLQLDGRQSDAALRIQRGLGRLLVGQGFSVVTEVALKTGRRVDIMALGPKGDLWVAEIKSSLADYRADDKWPEYREFCDRLYFAVAPDFPREVLPGDVGLFVADEYGAELLAEAPEHRLAAARRKAVTLRFARAAADRLQRLHDPAGFEF